jgi:aspartate kinase
MKIVVLKFGGTSVGTIEKIKNVANIITTYNKQRYKVIVVSSAMSGITNDLVNKSKVISENFSDEEYDVLVSSGEQVSCSLIAGRLIHLGLKSRSWLAWQIPILTEGFHKYSRINKINKNKIINYLKKGGIPVITGFQGVNKENRVTTIGRGGSDASAIMLAKFFNAERCVIYTDVEGVYTTDPNKLNKAKKIKVISYEEMLEMASLGTKVMQPVSIQDARLNRIDIEVKSSFVKKPGTLITNRSNIINNKIITGISSTQNDAKVTLVGVKDKPGVAASIFKPLSKNSINVDMVVQNISANGKETDLTFTIKSADLTKTKKIITENKSINFRNLLFNKGLSKISIIGVGMITTPGVTFRMFQALANKRINIQVISTSEIKISVLIDKKNINKALATLHKEFKLDK